MSEFHRSLDRALEHQDGAYERFVEAVPRAIIAQDDTTVTFRVNPGTPQERYYRAPEPVADPEAVEPLGEGWQDVGWIDETWESRDLKPLMAAIDRGVASMARARDYFTIDRTTAYDGVDVAIEWREPVVRPLEFTASIETIELLCGASLIPLCERQIPAEGTE